MSLPSQPGILAPVPQVARYITLTTLPEASAAEIRKALGRLPIDDSLVVGLGRSLIGRLEREIEGLRSFPSHELHGLFVPSTPADVWCWLRANDRGELVHATHALMELVGEAFVESDIVDGFMYRDSRDLSGYVNGTENPTDEAAVAAGIVQSDAGAMNGSSFVAVQRWLHDLPHFASMEQGERDNVIGRRLSDNEEIDDAPASAHVKRTAQESFSPEAFVLRRSMPWASEAEEGLVFVAFGCSLNRFEALLTRMVGTEDNITDALFRFTRPVTGAYFWCPPVADGRLNLKALGV